ncbi:MAG: carbohydrate kinase family protein [Actinomycetota bacterium]
MLGTLGDLVEDIVVRLGGPINIASDTDALVVRRRGGSAANVAASAARAGFAARFIGQVGSDAHGGVLIDALRGDGVDVVCPRGGRTGTVVVLVDQHGERTMLSDRGSCGDLADPDPAWLDGLSALHVPLYSLIDGALAQTASTLIQWAHERGILVSIDASSAAVIIAHGVDRVVEMLAVLCPDVLLCNELEAACLGDAVDPLRFAGRVTVVKHGSGASMVTEVGHESIAVPTPHIDNVRDTTGAGDAFAAGFLTALIAGESMVAATNAGHVIAGRAIVVASAQAA